MNYKIFSCCKKVMMLPSCGYFYASRGIKIYVSGGDGCHVRHGWTLIFFARKCPAYHILCLKIVY